MLASISTCKHKRCVLNITHTMCGAHRVCAMKNKNREKNSSNLCQHQKRNSNKLHRAYNTFSLHRRRRRHRITFIPLPISIVYITVYTFLLCTFFPSMKFISNYDHCTVRVQNRRYFISFSFFFLRAWSVPFSLLFLCAFYVCVFFSLRNGFVLIDQLGQIKFNWNWQRESF